MDEKIEERVVIQVLENTAKLLGREDPIKAAALMLAFIHHAAHMTMQLTDAETAAKFLNDLAEHLPNCDHAPSAQPHAKETTPTTKH